MRTTTVIDNNDDGNGAHGAAHVYDNNGVGAGNGDGSRGPVLKAFATARNFSTVIGAIGSLGLVIAFILSPRDFYSSFLYGWVFWMGLTIGCVGLTMLHHMVRGSWGSAILRILEAGNRNLWLMALLFVPIALGAMAKQIYPWANPEAVKGEEIWQHRAAFFNIWFWIGRSVVYFGVLIGVMNYLNASSLKQDRTKDLNLLQARTDVSAPFFVILFIIVTFGFTDWVMSLSEWYSTIYGVWFAVTGGQAAMALATYIVCRLADRKPYSEVITPALTKDFGNLLFMFTMLWAYISLSQFLIIWSGNLPEEVTFYYNRFRGGMVFIGAFLILGQFFLPFLLLLSGKSKRFPVLLRKIALWILFVRFVDMFWQVTPFFRRGLSVADLPAYALDLAAVAGIGGIWFALFFASLRKHPLLPAHDTRLLDAALAEAH